MTTMKGTSLDLADVLKARLITIDAQRAEAFKRRNPFLPFVDITPGTKEELIAPDELAAIATHDIVVAAKECRGSIGNAHSIYHILQACIADNMHYLILEDDVTLHPELPEYLIANWAEISSLDFLALGTNTDAPITFEPMNGMRFSGMFLQPEDRHPSESRIVEILSSYPRSAITLFKVHKMFGTCAFMVSPSGARKLLDAAFPLDSTPIDVPLLPHRLLAISFDRKLNSVLEVLDAKICMPFLAISPNDTKSQR